MNKLFIKRLFASKENLTQMVILLTSLLVMLLSNVVMAQTAIPFVFQNNSTFADTELYVAIVGQNTSSQSIWIDCKTGAQNPMTSSYNTVLGPTYGGNKGPGGNSLYASCFTKLSDVPNKTVMLPGISGCRVFISVGQQLYFYFFANGGYTSPSATDPTDPNVGIRYELIELTYNQIALFANTTRVDSYQYPMGLELFGANGYDQRVGELKTHAEIVALWKTSVPTEFQNCLNTTTGVITAPSKTKEFADGTIGTMPTPGPYVDYLKPYIDQVWTKYTNEDLIFNAGDAGVFRGRIVADRLSLLCTGGGFSGRTGIVTRKPTTQEVLEGKGVFNQAVSDTPVDLAVEAQMTAALNRHAINVTTPNVGQQDFSNSANYYTTAPTNYYAKFWHLPGISIGQLSYGFAYDDVFNYSSSLVAPGATKAIAVFGGYAGTLDVQAPSVPTNLVSPSVSTTSVNLTWTASTDNVGVAGYEVYVNAETTPRTTVTTASATIGSLTAGTTYNFKVRAKDAANNFSAYSATLSVTTSSATMTNLALAKPVIVSSTENAGTPGSSAVDGNAGTRWSSAASDPQWLYVDLGAAYTINRVKITWETALGKDYQIQTSTNTTAWTTLKTVTGNAALVNDQAGLTGSGRYVRIYGTARGTQWGYSIWELEVYGTSGTTNVAPMANAGVDKSITLPTSNVVINGTGTDTDGTISSYAWTRISGPNTPTLSGAATANVTASGLIAGTYAFRLTVTDNGGLTGSDDVNVVVTTANTAPTANAGVDKSITLPTNSVVINGSGTDTGGTISGYAWTRISGPNTPTLTGAGSANLTISGMIGGTYVYRLTVTDNGGLTGSDDVTIVVSNTSTVNIALNKPTVVSTTENAGTPGALAVDGNGGTRWSSAAADPQWIYVDLGDTYTVNRVKVTWETALGKDYLVQTALSTAGPWTTIKTVTGNTTLVNDHTGLSGGGRYVRIYGTARGTQWGYSIWELEVFGFNGARLTSPDVESIKESIGFYPNPTENTVHIKGMKDGATIIIRSLSGSESSSFKISNGTIDVTPLSPGAYIIDLCDGAKTIRKKIIKK